MPLTVHRCQRPTCSNTEKYISWHFPTDWRRTDVLPYSCLAFTVWLCLPAVKSWLWIFPHCKVLPKTSQKRSMVLQRTAGLWAPAIFPTADRLHCTIWNCLNLPARCEELMGLVLYLSWSRPFFFLTKRKKKSIEEKHPSSFASREWSALQISSHACEEHFKAKQSCRIGKYDFPRVTFN